MQPRPILPTRPPAPPEKQTAQTASAPSPTSPTTSPTAVADAPVTGPPQVDHPAPQPAPTPTTTNDPPDATPSQAALRQRWTLVAFVLLAGALWLLTQPLVVVDWTGGAPTCDPCEFGWDVVGVSPTKATLLFPVFLFLSIKRLRWWGTLISGLWTIPTAMAVTGAPLGVPGLPASGIAAPLREWAAANTGAIDASVSVVTSPVWPTVIVASVLLWSAVFVAAAATVDLYAQRRVQDNSASLADQVRRLGEVGLASRFLGHNTQRRDERR